MIDWAAIIGFEWDEANESKNYKKHRVGCHEAESIFVAADLRILEDSNIPPPPNSAGTRLAPPATSDR
jgi:hypothetical protein